MISKNIKPSWIFLIISILIGGYIRISPVINLDYPINDGGMFFSMTQDLQENSYHIPDVTSYNGLDIPYAYPPFGFFLAGLIEEFSGWSLIDIFRFLPALMSILTIPAFYFLARLFLSNELQLSLATLIFSLLPSSFDWLIMGGGITRAIGFLFSILTLYYLYLSLTQDQFFFPLLSGLFAGLTILSHPEHALHTAACSLVFFYFLRNNRKSLYKATVIVVLALLISLPWWATVVRKFGFSPFINAAGTGNHTIQAYLNIITYDFTHELGLKSIGFLALIGLFIFIARKQYLVPLWIFIIFLSEPRSAPQFQAITFSICASVALFEIINILSKSEAIENKFKENITFENQLFIQRIPKIVIGILMIQWIISAYSVGRIEAKTTSITNNDIAAFSWVKANTEIDSTFIILTGQSPLSDPITEWFPSMADRTNINTVQGHEWINSVNFYDFLSSSIKVQNCYIQDIFCVEQWTKENEVSYEYILVRKLDTSYYQSTTSNVGLISSLIISKDYISVYDSENISIFLLDKE